MDHPGPNTILPFLLSLGAIPLACIGDDSDKDGGGSATVSTSTSAEPTEPTETSGSSPGSEGTVDPPGLDPCVIYAEKYDSCDDSVEYEDALDYCQENNHWFHTAYSTACASSYEDYYECVGSLSCHEIDAGEELCIKYIDVEACEEPMPPSACIAYGEARRTCGTELDGVSAEEVCVEYIFMGTFFEDLVCAETVEDYFSCLSALSCVELAAVEAEEITDPCIAAVMCEEPPPPAPK